MGKEETLLFWEIREDIEAPGMPVKVIGWDEDLARGVNLLSGSKKTDPKEPEGCGQLKEMP